MSIKERMERENKLTFIVLSILDSQWRMEIWNQLAIKIKNQATEPVSKILSVGQAIFVIC